MQIFGIYEIANGFTCLSLSSYNHSIFQSDLELLLAEANTKVVLCKRILPSGNFNGCVLSSGVIPLTKSDWITLCKKAVLIASLLLGHLS